MIQPAIDDASAPRTLAVGEFLGVYGDADGRFYEVTIMERAGGIAVSLPGGAVMRFPDRHEASFRGWEGTISFTVEGRRVTGPLPDSNEDQREETKVVSATLR